MGWRVLLGESSAALQRYVFQNDGLQVEVDACAAGIGIIHLPD